MSREIILYCPRCGQMLIAKLGMPDAECNCHLYCTQGEKPSDCTVTWPYNWSGQLGWPMGLVTGQSDEGDHKYRANGYCLVHDEYYYKDKMVIELDWERLMSQRVPSRYRMSMGEY